MEIICVSRMWRHAATSSTGSTAGTAVLQRARLSPTKSQQYSERETRLRKMHGPLSEEDEGGEQSGEISRR